MAKRRLTRQQQSRIRQQREARKAQAAAQAFDAATASDESVPLLAGTVISHFGQQLEIETQGVPEARERFRCFARANLGPLVTGDNVLFRQGPAEEGVIESLEDRHSLLCRPDKFGKLKPVAANIDRLVIVIAPEPEPFANLIDRYLVASELSQVEPLLVLNKADLMGEPHSSLVALLNRYERLGYQTLRASVTAHSGLDELRQTLEGRTSVLVGQSGVGKSSLIQALLPDETLRVGALSQAQTKGTHTTTAARLYHLPQDLGRLVDSPGIREFGLWHVTEHELLQGFRELSELSGHCRFRDCKHFVDPGCALTQALKSGDIHPERANSYQLIRDSLGEVNIRPMP